MSSRYRRLQESSSDSSDSSDDLDFDKVWFDRLAKNVKKDFGSYYASNPAVGALLYLIKQMDKYLNNELRKLNSKIDSIGKLI